MDSYEVMKILFKGEDSKTQFKENVVSQDQFSSEITAFSNSDGGLIIIGVDDKGNVTGLEKSDIGRLNQLISNAASQGVNPPVDIKTENIVIEDKVIILAHISEGFSKPYMDNHRNIWVKKGADKRKVTAREELQRMFQRSSLIHADLIPVNGSNIDSVDREYFDRFFERQYGKSCDETGVSFSQLMLNLKLMEKEYLNIAGTLLFAKRPENLLPQFIVKCASFPGNDVTPTVYRDSEDIIGKMEHLYKGVMGFISRNLHHIQNGKSVNSVGDLEIPSVVFEELVANALIHRDYFISAPVRVFIFDDRVEIISPGHLPNSLTIENIKGGNSNIRNATLASFAAKILPYRGLGSGIIRAMKAYPDIELVDDRDGNLFKAIIKRTTN